MIAGVTAAAAAATVAKQSQQEEEAAEREDFTLPPESVTGYRTPGGLIHPNRPVKVSWDLLIGGSAPAPPLVWPRFVFS